MGEIALDLTLNQGSFNKQMSSIQGIATKAGAALAAAFGTKKIIDFGKQCIELGSDLAEVQNVVDVTFPTMTSKIDKFSKNAAATFGLSETMAKKFTGTFGSMAEAFGFTEKQSADMATTLTGLAGDVASFYNISQDEAYTKLKSVFSGETETLKDLGIVMTQSALDAYALANGYKKTTAEMTEMEKVSLRYAFVQSQLTNAAGDFARTSDSWANQVRLLSLQFDSLRATIGQGLINVFTPVIKWLNILIAKLSVAANAFKNFTEALMGKHSADNNTANSAANTADAMNSASDASKQTEKSTKKTAANLKKAQTYLFSFDKLNKIDSTDTTKDKNKAGSGAGNGTGIKADVDTSEIDKAAKKIEKLKKIFVALKNNFTKGFKIGLGDMSVLDSIKANLVSIEASFLEIASSKEVQTSLGNLFLTVAESTGKVAGSVSSIALTIADNLTGGLSKYLDQDKGRIKESLVSIFDCRAEISKLVSDLCVSLADIYTVFRSDDAKQITADYIKIFSDTFLGTTELAVKFSRDLTKVISQPITENAGKIKKALSKTLKPIKNIFDTISTSVGETMDKINQVYDQKIGPALQSFADGITDIVETCVDNYNKYIVPVLDELSKEFDKIWKNCIQPVLNKAIDLIGNIASCTSAFWSNILAPLIQWLIDALVPIVMPVIKKVFEFALKVFGGIGTAVGILLDALNGIIKFLTGVFKVDWKKTWNNVKEIFSKVGKKIGDIVTKLKTKVKDEFNKLKNSVIDKVTETKTKAVETVNTLKSKVLETVDTLKSKASEKVKALKTTFIKTFTSIRDRVTSIFKKMYDKGIKSTINAILLGIEKMANGVIKGFNAMINSINKFGFKMPGWLPKKWADKEMKFNIKQLSEVQIPRLANGGYVKANTPQLAMIGDNRHQGEVVAPEEKLLELLKVSREQTMQDVAAVLASMSGTQTGGDTEIVINIGSKKIMQEVLKAAKAGNKRMGKIVYDV